MQPTSQMQTDDDQWWEDRVQEILDQAEARHPMANQEEGYAERYLTHARLLIDATLDHLQHFAVHNPCGDGEVVELADGEEACAGCFDANGNPR